MLITSSLLCSIFMLKDLFFLQSWEQQNIFCKSLPVNSLQVEGKTTIWDSWKCNDSYFCFYLYLFSMSNRDFSKFAWKDSTDCVMAICNCIFSWLLCCHYCNSSLCNSQARCCLASWACARTVNNEIIINIWLSYTVAFFKNKMKMELKDKTQCNYDKKL